MNDNTPLENPDLGLFAFFNHKDGEQAAQDWCDRLLKRLGMPPRDGNNISDVEDKKSLRYLQLYPLHDGLVVYISINKKGYYSSIVWQQLSKQVLGNNWQELPEEPSFWGISLFFGAVVRSLPDDSTQKAWLTKILLPPQVGQRLEPVLSAYAWGNFWQLTGTQQLSQPMPQVYATLFLVEHEAQTQDRLFAEGDTSLGFLELNLNKAYYQLEQFYQLKDTWKERRDELEQALQSLLSRSIQQATAERHTRFRADLDSLRHKYVDFNHWTTHVAALQQTLRLNTDNYRHTADKLELLHQNDLVFTTNLHRLKQGLEQLVANVHYDEIAMQRLTIGLQTIQADLDLSLVEAQKREDKREVYNDRLLVLIGALLGLTQLYPFIQDMMNNWPFCALSDWLCSPAWRWSANLIILLAFMMAFWGIYAWWRKNKPTE